MQLYAEATAFTLGMGDNNRKIIKWLLLMP